MEVFQPWSVEYGPSLHILVAEQECWGVLDYAISKTTLILWIPFIHVFVWGVLIKMHIKFYTVNKKKKNAPSRQVKDGNDAQNKYKTCNCASVDHVIDHWTNSAAISLHSVLNFVLIILKRLSQRLWSKWFGVTLTHTLSCYQAFPNICRREITWRCYVFHPSGHLLKEPHASPPVFRFLNPCATVWTFLSILVYI